MKIIYPYNEILPKKKAHDVYIFNNCLSLAEREIEVHLLCGHGSDSYQNLLDYYGQRSHSHFHIQTLPIIRKNNIFNLSWNLPFFSFSQTFIKKNNPDWVLFSVLKQAAFHLKRKLSQIRYAYEVHQLNWYPGQPIVASEIELEKQVFDNCDLVIVTTEQLKKILQEPPYLIKTPIKVVPLAVKAEPLPPCQFYDELTLAYVGQLYPLQGVASLIEALSQTSSIKLKIIGGRKEEISALKARAEKLNLSSKISFLGFMQPKDLQRSLNDVHAFAAPFLSQERMPYVAHTKLLEYAIWNRPIIAPNLPICREHLKEETAFYFEPNDSESLSHTLHRLLHTFQQSKIPQFPSPDYGWQKRAAAYSLLLKEF